MRSNLWARTALSVVIMLVVAACGGGDDSAGVASIEDVTTRAPDVAAAEDGSLGGDEAAVLEFAACMRESGIDFPDPVVNADGNVGFDLMAMSELADIDEDEIEAAFEACFTFLEGVSFGFETIFEPEFQDAVLEFSMCMRENGFDMPDPDFSAITGGGPLFSEEPDIDDPDFESAFEACQDKLPGIPGITQ